MINPNSFFGRALIVFFWGGLSASIVNMLWTVWHFDPLFIAWFVVLVNMIAVTLKNVILPVKKK